jgi:hypothetical protein
MDFKNLAKPGEFDLFIPRPKGRGNNKVKNEWAYHFAIFNCPAL